MAIDGGQHVYFTLRYTPDRMLGGSQGLLVHSGVERERERERERETCHSWKINPGLLARCSVTIVTEIFPLILELV